MSSQYGELRPTSGWDRFGCLGHPSKFQCVLCLGFITAATSLNGSQPNFARCLAISWVGTLNIHFRGLLPRNQILPGAKFNLGPRLALSYSGSVTARHSSNGRQTNFAALSRRRHLYLAENTTLCDITDSVSTVWRKLQCYHLYCIHTSIAFCLTSQLTTLPREMRFQFLSENI